MTSAVHGLEKEQKLIDIAKEIAQIICITVRD
jgi:hypothetical protein